MQLIAHLDAADYPPEAQERLQKLGHVYHVGSSSRRQLLEQLSALPFTILVCGLGSAIDAELLECVPDLKVILTATTGLDHIDLVATSSRGITVLSLRDARERLTLVGGTAELTVGLMLAVTRKVPQASRAAQDGLWASLPWRGPEMRNSTLGIVGFGRLGRAVSNLAAAFGMTILAHDRRPLRPLDFGDVVHIVGADELLAQSDIVTLHMDLNDSSLNWLNQTRIQALKHGSFVINSARGELVDELALARALRTGHLSGVAVDVLRGDVVAMGQTPEGPLLEASKDGYNVIITPHIGGQGEQSVFVTRNLAIDLLVDYMSVGRSNVPITEYPDIE